MTRYVAENALATLHNVQVTHHLISWTLVLSHNSNFDPPCPPHETQPLFVWSFRKLPHPLMGKTTEQQLFNLFRNAGPLVSVNVGVELGMSHPTAVLQFWHPEHAAFAKDIGSQLHQSLLKLDSFILRNFDPCTLHCTVSFECERLSIDKAVTNKCAQNLPASISHTIIELIFSKVA